MDVPTLHRDGEMNSGIGMRGKRANITSCKVFPLPLQESNRESKTIANEKHIGAKIHPSPEKSTTEDAKENELSCVSENDRRESACDTLFPAKLLSLWSNSRKFKNRAAFTFLNSNDKPVIVTNHDLWEHSGGIAAALKKWGAQKGDRVLLVYPPGLEFVAALIACFRVGVIAVPAYPPNPKSLAQQAGVLGSIAQDAGARIALTDSSYIWVARYAATYMTGTSLSRSASKWMRASRWFGGSSKDDDGHADGITQIGDGLDAWPVWLHWYSTSNLDDCGSFEDEHVVGDDVAFLQYTSGSTSAPKGVMITYSALSHNIYMMIRASKHSTVLFDNLDVFDSNTNDKVDRIPLEDDPGTIVSWLPQYHDMGLIGSTLCSLYVPGGSQVQMSPFTFLRNPLLWAEAITKYQATVITAPDFGYSQLVKYTLAAGRKGSFQAAKYDFSHLRLALNGAGMIKHKTMRDFFALFKHAGLPSQVFGGGYGLAEHCVYVCHGGETILSVDRKALGQGRLLIQNQSGTEVDRTTPNPSPTSTPDSSIVFKNNTDESVSLVSCGKVNCSDIDIRIVDPSDCTKMPSGSIGEIWISSPSKTAGYWKKEEETQKIFHASIKYIYSQHAGKSHEKEYLRTGDLGFIWQNELYFVSRMKDLIVIHGRNIIPDDVELIISQSHKLIRTGCVAAFQLEEDVMCAVAEVRTPDLDASQLNEIKDEVLHNMRKHNISLHALELIHPRSIPKTTSGKVRRSECRQRFVDDMLDIVCKTDLSFSSKKRLELDVESLSHLTYGEARTQILDYLLNLVRGMGLHVRARDNLTDHGLDSSLMVRMHKALEEVFARDLSPSVLLDHDNLYSIASYLTKEIQKDSGVTFGSFSSEDPDVESIIDIGDYTGAKEISFDKKATIRRSSSRFFLFDVSSLCMIVYFVIMFQFAMNSHRTVDGMSLSFWEQEPRHFFKRSVSMAGSRVKLQDGLFGRKMDGYHTHLLVWGLEVLPMHLISGLLLVIARRVPWINRNWSPAAITVGVSLCHIFCLHGLSAFWSLGSASINFLVCRIAVTLAQHHSPSKSRWLIWGCNLFLILGNKVTDFHFKLVGGHYFPEAPTWIVHGICRQNIQQFSAFSSFKYLALRQLSYSLDVLDEVSQAKKKGKNVECQESQSSLQYWAYILYAPLYMHGPCMQYRHFRASSAAVNDLKHKSKHDSSKTERHSRSQLGLSLLIHRFSLILGRLSVGLRELGGTLAMVALLFFALHTFYMPTIVFLKIHESAAQVKPMNLLGYEYFVYYNFFMFTLFMQSFVVFTITRAIALADGVDPPKDVLISYLRSSVSVQAHWNSFHVSWRQFFFRYIVMQNKDNFQYPYVFILDLSVFMFSAFLHSEFLWYIYFFYYFLVYQVEKFLFRWKRFRNGDAFVRGIYQSLLVSVNFLFFPGILLKEVEKKGDLQYSIDGIQYFLLFSTLFFALNIKRIEKNPDSFI